MPRSFPSENSEPVNSSAMPFSGATSRIGRSVLTIASGRIIVRVQADTACRLKYIQRGR
jgi:hypothetical protein